MDVVAQTVVLGKNIEVTTTAPKGKASLPGRGGHGGGRQVDFSAPGLSRMPTGQGTTFVVITQEWRQLAALTTSQLPLPKREMRPCPAVTPRNPLLLPPCSGCAGLAFFPGLTSELAT